MMMTVERISKFLKATGKFLKMEESQVAALDQIFKICFAEENVTPIIGTTQVSEFSTPRFEKLSNGWVRDSDLCIDWGPTHSKELNYAEAIGYCTEEAAALPTLEQLQSLVDYERHNPAIDTEFFPDTKSSWYWTSSPVHGYDNCAWCVDFHYGGVGNDVKDDLYYVRPVRASQ